MPVMNFMKSCSSDTTCKRIITKNYFPNGNLINQEIHTFLLWNLSENTAHFTSDPPTERLRPLVMPERILTVLSPRLLLLQVCLGF